MTSLSLFSKPNIRDLDSIFSETPQIVRENLKYISYDPYQKQFTCSTCRIPITKSNCKVEIITNNFYQHLNSPRHIQNTSPASAIREQLTNEQLTNLFHNKVPQVVKENVSVIGLRENNYICTACDEVIQKCINPYETSSKLSCHFALKSHDANMTKHTDLLSHLYDIYGRIPSILIMNSDHLTKVSSAEYKCTACDHSLKIQLKDRKETEEEFTDHLSTESHKRNAQQAKAYALVPELEYICDVLPNHILRNIEYISVNGSDFFCSLCNTNISFSEDLFETQHNLRVHLLLTDHETRLNARMDLNNRAFSMLQAFFGGFPLPNLSDNFKYIGFVENGFGCNLCNEMIIGGDEENGSIRDALLSHFASCDHKSNVQSNKDQQSQVLEDLDDLYGAVPQIIKDNIEHILFNDGINFKCILCSEPLKAKKNCSYVVNTFTTRINFELHLNSHMHVNGLETLEFLEDEVKKSLQSLYPQLPQYILINLQHLAFREGTEDYHCYLCDQPITVVSGRNGIELTRQNFISHLYSENHLLELKNQANREQDCLSALESVFYKVPSVIASGAKNLVLQKSSYYCNLCKVSMKRSKEYLSSHFYGRNHRSRSEDLEYQCTEAFYQLDRRFLRIPESVLRNIDFLIPIGNNLLCAPCKDVLPLDKRNLESTKNLLKIHMCSNKHKSNLVKK